MTDAPLEAPKPKLSLKNDTIVIPASQMPAFRTSVALQDGCERNIIFRTWGGIGDQICAEPTLRYALREFKDCQISLASESPELFRHLKFKRVFDLREEQPIWDRYLTLDTIVPPTNLIWQFVCHMLVNCVDFPAICALRGQLPVSDREVKLVPDDDTQRDMQQYVETTFDRKRAVVVHPGKHWQSKTFPKLWWDAVLYRISNAGCQPIIIGAKADDNRGTVDVETNLPNLFDLRDSLSIMETVALLQNMPVLLTNDSSPLHMAVTGSAWIGYVATVKHPDHITHWRRGQWGWRMQNHGRGGIWDVIDHCPNKDKNVEVETVDDALLTSWLPNPVEFANWGMEKLHDA